jgi:crotonobetainyl-CoA:carnitine CoA-transferase CaiB-like acyl-CoA transferase
VTAGNRGRRRLPLAGIRILDFTVVWAGPYATQLLAEWGAEVIRVESTQFFPSTTRGALARPSKQLVEAGGAGGYPDYDPGERPWNRTALFNTHGRNKRSMTVDLTQPEGQEAFHRLVEVSDGLIENNALTTMERAGVSWERLSAVNPRFILVRMPAFGITGPYQRYRTFGSHMESLVGHYSVFGYPGAQPDSSGTSLLADPAAGVSGVVAFMAGLRHRRRTGEGLQLELATAENFAGYLGEYVLDYSMNGRLADYLGNRDLVQAPQGVYLCAGEDRWLAITVDSDEAWRALCGVMERDDLASEARYATVEGRRAAHDELDAQILTWSVFQDPIEAMQRLQAAGVVAGAVMNERDAYADPHLRERGYFETLEHPEAGTYEYPGVLWRAERTPNHLRRAAPRLGEDNAYVYRELLGYSEDEYRALEEAGHIGMDYDPSIP